MSLQLDYDASRRSPGTSVEITRLLLARLTAGHLAVGQKLPSERQLAEDLGVGRSTIREVLKSLALLGLLDIRQGDGTYLSANTSDVLPQVVEWSLLLGGRSIHSLTEARLHLEVLLATMTADRRSENDLELLRGVFARMTDAVDSQNHQSYAEADADFHVAIANASGNEILASVLGSIRALLRSWTEQVTSGPVTLEQSLAVHRPILDAIASGNSDAAGLAMKAHMDQAILHLAETLEGLNPQSNSTK